MSSFVWIFVLILTLTVLGSSALLFVTVKYYWGERGQPPLTGDDRRKQYKAELDLRAKQFEYSRKHPPRARSMSFWDNTKQP